MANGIKLRRGLQTALVGTIADGELVMATDTGKLGLKKGATEHFVDLPTLVDTVANIQTQQAGTSGNIEVNYFRLFDFYNPNEVPTFGKVRIPIASINPLALDISEEVIQFISVKLVYSILIKLPTGELFYSVDSKPNFSANYSINCILLADYGYGLYASSNMQVSDNSLNDSLGISLDTETNIVYAELPENFSEEIKGILVDFSCIFKSVVRNIGGQNISVFLPPTNNEVILEESNRW